MAHDRKPIDSKVKERYAFLVGFGLRGAEWYQVRTDSALDAWATEQPGSKATPGIANRARTRARPEHDPSARLTPGVKSVAKHTLEPAARLLERNPYDIEYLL